MNIDMAVGIGVWLWFKVPRTIRLKVNGRLPDKVCSKDIILHLIGGVGADGARYMAASALTGEITDPRKV